MQHRETECSHQHHIAWRRQTMLPAQQRPGQQAGGENGGDAGMQHAQLFEVPQALPSRRHFTVDIAGEAPPLAADGAESAYYVDIVDDINQLAIDRRGGDRVILVQAASNTREIGQNKA